MFNLIPASEQFDDGYSSADDSKNDEAEKASKRNKSEEVEVEEAKQEHRILERHILNLCESKSVNNIAYGNETSRFTELHLSGFTLDELYHLFCTLTTTTYHWSHDKIQQAAFSLIQNSSERYQIHLHFGSLACKPLMGLMESEEFDVDDIPNDGLYSILSGVLIYIAADQYNQVPIDVLKGPRSCNEGTTVENLAEDRSKRKITVDIANLNLEAAKVSISRVPSTPLQSYLELPWIF